MISCFPCNQQPSVLNIQARRLVQARCLGVDVTPFLTKLTHFWKYTPSLLHFVLCFHIYPIFLFMLTAALWGYCCSYFIGEWHEKRRYLLEVTPLLSGGQCANPTHVTVNCVFPPHFLSRLKHRPEAAWSINHRGTVQRIPEFRKRLEQMSFKVPSRSTLKKNSS